MGCQGHDIYMVCYARLSKQKFVSGISWLPSGAFEKNLILIFYPHPTRMSSLPLPRLLLRPTRPVLSLLLPDTRPTRPVLSLSGPARAPTRLPAAPSPQSLPPSTFQIILS
jgi:hypothetical protein